MRLDRDKADQIVSHVYVCVFSCIFTYLIVSCSHINDSNSHEEVEHLEYKIEQLESDIDELRNEISDNESRITDNEANIADCEDRLDVAETDIYSLQVN